MVIVMSRRLSRLAVLCLGATLNAGCAGPTEPPAPSERVRAGAMQAQQRCYPLIHHDTWEFGDCVRILAGNETPSDEVRLGVEYFGWVGAMNSARLGMLGADETAQEFLSRFRATQAKLKVDDRALCAVVPGDCTARIARLEQMEREFATGASQSRRP